MLIKHGDAKIIKVLDDEDIDNKKTKKALKTVKKDVQKSEEIKKNKSKSN